MTIAWPNGTVILAKEWQPFLDLLVPLYVRKSSDENRGSDTVLSADDDLFVYVQANSVYRMRSFLIYKGDLAGDIKIAWTAPTGASMQWNIRSSVNTMASATSDIWFGSVTLADSAGPGAIGTGTPICCMPHGLLRTGSANGRFGLQWAQLASSATATTILASSFLILTKLA